MSRKLALTIRAALVVVAFTASARAQVANDHCSSAIPIGPGVTLGSNIGATSGPEPLAGCGIPAADVWYVFVAPCDGPWEATTCHAGTNFDTVLTIWDGSAGCGLMIPILCNDDFCGQPFSPTNSYVTFQSVAGATYYFSVAGHLGAQGAFEFSVESNGTELHFFASGPGTIGYQVLGGPVGGSVLTALTLDSTFYPYGWFHGISIGVFELINEIWVGFPFLLVAGPVCGDVTVGPFGGLPPGLTLYGVSLGIPSGAAYPHPAFISAPDSFAVP